MTHGCGALSSASSGCSGFSGSTFNAASAAIYAASSSQTSRSRRSNNVGETDVGCVDFCVGCAKCIGFLLSLLFCTRKVSRDTRIMVTWFWVVVFSVSSSLIVGMGLFGANEFPAATSDMRIIDKSYSTFICDSFMVEPSHKSNIYLMSEVPLIDHKHRKTYNTTVSMTVSSGTYEYWGFYLLAGSSVTVRSCTGGRVTFYVIKGYDNLHEWISDNSCSSCYMYSARLPVNKFCNPFISPDYFRYQLNRINFSEDIFFVYAADRYSNIRVRFELDKTSYNVSSALQARKGVFYGFFELSYDSPEVIIYQIESGLTSDSTVSIKTHCYPRVILYMVFFVFPPLIVGLVVTYFLYKNCNNPEQSSATRERRRVQLVNEGPRTPLLSAEHSTRNSIQQQPGATTAATLLTNPVGDDLPPKYETVEHTKKAPPSYEESLNSTR